jgi:sugar lactone lactonase YvrE
VAITAWHNSMVVGWEADTGELVPICGSGERSYTGDGGPAVDATVDLPAAVEFDEQDRLLIVDQASQRLRRIDHEGVITSIAGTGIPGYTGDGAAAIEAQIHAPVGQTALPAGRLAVAPDGTIYHGDRGNHCVRRIDPDGTIHTVAGTGKSGYSGDGGPATEAELNNPVGVALDAHGRLYIADTENHCVRRLDLDGTIHTVVGTCTERGDRGEGGPPTEARLDRPYGVTVSPDGDLYVVDTYNHRIRRVHPEAP